MDSLAYLEQEQANYTLTTIYTLQALYICTNVSLILTGEL
jgi:hypothetical protein